MEGPAGLLYVYGVRALPVAVPGLEHREAALPEAADHVPAGPRPRQGALPAGGRRQVDGGRGEGHRGAARRRPRRGPGGGGAPPDRHRGGERGDRPGRPVVVHHLRRVRRAVPGRHRARRPHRRHAPLPGDDRVGVPVRGGHDAEEPGEEGQSLGPGEEAAPGMAQGGRLRGPRRRPGHRRPHRGRVPVLGGLRGRPGGPGEEDHEGLRRAPAHRGREVRDHGR